jgi:hypothetical protein
MNHKDCGPPRLVSSGPAIHWLVRGNVVCSWRRCQIVALPVGTCGVVGAVVQTSRKSGKARRFSLVLVA